MSTATRRMLDAIAATPEGVFAVDEAQRIVLWNEGASRIMGYASSEVLGKPCHEVIAGCDAERNPACRKTCPDILLARAKQPIPTRDLAARTSDGDEVDLNVTNLCLPADRSHSVVVHVFRPVTVQRRMEQLLKRLSRHVDQCPAFQVGPSSNGHSTAQSYDQLTSREREVLKLLAEGNNATSIAKTLVISPATVRKHIQNMLRKLGMHSCLEAVAYVSRLDVVQDMPEVTFPFPTPGLEAGGW